MVKKVIEVNPNKRPWEQQTPPHNRWHPDIPSVAHVEQGEVFRIECMDWTGGQIRNNNSADDVKNIDLTQPHYLSGPVAVWDAEPGDLLKVEILNAGPLEGQEWGFTGSFDKENGGGFLTDHFPGASKAIWDLQGINCSSRHIPGVKFAGLIHPGVIGTAPNEELLRMWNSREATLVSELGTEEEKTLCNGLFTRPLAKLPEAKGALLGKLGHTEMAGQSKKWDRVAEEGARTTTARCNGGSCGIKNLSRGSTAYLPVYVPGGNLSVGDIQFSSGDGKISLCGGISMWGFLELKCTVIKDGMKLLPENGMSPLNVNPIFESGPLEPRYSEWLIFEGISVDETGVQHYLDATVAYKMACLNAIKYFTQFGYTEEQIYLLLSCIPCEGRISGIVDAPNAVATLAIPLAIFDKDVRPPSRMSKLEKIAKSIRHVKKNVIIADEQGNPEPKEPVKLDEEEVPKKPDSEVWC